MEAPRQLPRVHASDKNTLHPLPGRPEDPGLVTRKFPTFYKMKMFEQTIESELEDPLGSMKLQQKGIVVTDGLTSFVTSFVTAHH